MSHLTDQEFSGLVDDLEHAILKTIAQAGFKNGQAVAAAHMAALLVAKKVTRKKVTEGAVV